MKTINRLALALMLMGAAQGYSTNDTDDVTFFEIEECGRSKSKNDKRNDRKNDRKNDRRHGGNATGPQGEKGEKGDPGESLPVIHGYYYKTSNNEVAPKAAIVFEATGIETGGLKYDSSTGVLTIPEDGNYQISYFVDSFTAYELAVGIQLNDAIIPGSIYRASSSSDNHYMQLHGSVIVKANKDDSLTIINLSEKALLFYNSTASNVNGSLTIKKLN